MEKDESIKEWRQKIETELAGWKKVRYFFLAIVTTVVILLIIWRVPGYFENHSVALIAFLGILGHIVNNWNGSKEKRILLKILTKLEDIERE